MNNIEEKRKKDMNLDLSKKYKLIYADPPWKYRDREIPGGTANHYKSMSLEDIKNYPVPKISDADSILFLWSTFPMLKEALEVIKAWGFEYKTVGFVWVKRNRKSGGFFMGCGNWTRSNAEVCLIGVKGKPKRISGAVHSIIYAPVREHSRKPPEVRMRIRQLIGDVPSKELFAREKTKGWDITTNEVICSVDDWI